jgi:hypothetical protein
MKVFAGSVFAIALSVLVCIASITVAVRAEEDVLLQLVVYSNSEQTLTKIMEKNPSAEQELLGTFLASDSMAHFQAIESGKAVPTADGGHRALQLSLCPPKCAYSGSTYCRALGCAYCGGSCARRLLRKLTGTYGAEAIEANLDKHLARYCLSDANCKMWAKILVVNPDGTATELV